VLDEATLQDLYTTLRDRPQALANIYNTFLRSATALIDELPDQAGAARLATLHALKGSAGMIGASRIATLATTLHTLTGVSPDQRIDSDIEQLRSELAVFRKIITERLEALGIPFQR
jgi:HPt (histidine-containing phosphotransfer) domain-containing protein